MVYKKSINGVRWNLIINNSIYIINIIQFIIVAKFLSPTDFGLVGIIAPILAGLFLISDMGFGAALIQKQTENIGPYASSILILMLAISSFFGSLLVFFSEQIMNFYSRDELEELIYFSVLVLLVKSYSAIIVSLSHKKHDFKEESIGRFFGTLLGFLLAVFVAIEYNSYWALMIGFITQPVVTIVYLNSKLSYTRLKFMFDFDKIKEIYQFAFTLFFAKVIYFITRSGIGLILAKFFPSHIYGQFYFAQKTSEYPQTFFSGLINSIVFSSLSTIQNEDEKFRTKFLMLGGLVTFFTSPIALFLLYFSSDIVISVFGTKWIEAVDIFAYFMFYVLISTIGSIPAIAIQAKGNAKVLLNANYLRIPFVFFSIYFGIMYELSISSIAMMLVISEIFPIVYLVFYALKLLSVSYLDFFKNFIFQAILSLIALIISSNFDLLDFNKFINLIFDGVSFLIIYFILNYFFNKKLLKNVLIIVLDITKLKKHNIFNRFI